MIREVDGAGSAGVRQGSCRVSRPLWLGFRTVFLLNSSPGVGLLGEPDDLRGSQSNLLHVRPLGLTAFRASRSTASAEQINIRVSAIPLCRWFPSRGGLVRRAWANQYAQTCSGLAMNGPLSTPPALVLFKNKPVPIDL